MHSMGSLRLSHVMILIGILAALLISSTQSASLPYNSYGRGDLPVGEKPEIFLLLDQRLPEFENEMYAPGNDPVVRTKRITLSIVNPVQVLRDRVRLELARKQAMQDQRQIEANRRLLESIGKRSVPEFTPELRKIPRMDARKGRFANFEHTADRDDRVNFVQVPARSAQNWYNEDESDAFRDASDDQTRRIQTNEGLSSLAIRGVIPRGIHSQTPRGVFPSS